MTARRASAVVEAGKDRSVIRRVALIMVILAGVGVVLIAVAEIGLRTYLEHRYGVTGFSESDHFGGTLAPCGDRDSESGACVRLADFPPVIVAALLEIHDPGYLSRSKPILPVISVLMGRPTFSLIDVALARPAFKCSESDHWRSILGALRLARTYSRPHLLEVYLNRVRVYDTCEGVSDAATALFGKPINDLDEGEMVALALMSLGTGPNSKYFQSRFPAVLDTLTEKNVITASVAAHAKAVPPIFNISGCRAPR